MTTRRSFLTTLAVTFALSRFKPEPSRASVTAGPPGEVVFRNRNVGPLVLWWHRKAKSIKFYDCQLDRSTIPTGQTWTVYGNTTAGECTVRGMLVIGEYSKLTMQGDLILNNFPGTHVYRAYHPISA